MILTVRVTTEVISDVGV